jgi:PilZ domain-containing protein
MAVLDMLSRPLVQALHSDSTTINGRTRAVPTEHRVDAATSPLEETSESATDRRRAPRHTSDKNVRIAVSDDKPARTGRIINISSSGVLAVLHDPLGVWRGQRTVLSIDWPDTEHRHILSRVARVDRGADNQTYVAVEYDEPLSNTTSARTRIRETRHGR